MNKLGILALAASYAPRVFRVRRTTWISLALGFLVLAGLMLWAAIALAGWLWTQAGKSLDATPAVAHDAIKQLEQAIPGMRERLEIIVPSLKLPPVSDDPQQRRNTGTVGTPAQER